MAKEEFGLVQIDLVELSAAGPVYRLVMGQIAEGKKVAAWIDRQIVYSVDLSTGISREEAIEIAVEKGYSKDDEIHLVCKPPGIPEKLEYVNSQSHVF